MKGPLGIDGAIKDFEKKFRDKTRNAWKNRASFVPSAGKYTLIEVEVGEEEDVDDMRHKVCIIEIFVCICL